MGGRFYAALLLLGQMGFAQVWKGLQIDSVPIWHDSLSSDTSAFQNNSEKDSSHLETSGYKSISLVVGNDGTEVRQQMRLGIQGEAAPGWFVDAHLVDEGLHPGEQRVSTLQDMDEMDLRIMHGRGALTLGDFRYAQDSLTLFDTHHSSMGVLAEWNGEHLRGQWAGGQDPMQRQTVVFAGVDGQRDGYLLAPGNSGFVAVVPSSETIWLDGRKLIPNVDYHLDNSGGVLNFLGANAPGPSDQIRADYEVYGTSFSRTFLASDFAIRWDSWTLLVGSSGLWTDLAEVRRQLANSVTSDSTLTAGHPQDQRLAGARAVYEGKLLKASVEVAASRFDSNSIDSANPVMIGRAGRWTLATAGDWTRIRSGFQLDYAGSWLDSTFHVGEQSGRARDWDSWDLLQHWELDSLDSLQMNRHYEWARMGWGIGNSWRPWVGGGLRQLGTEIRSQRAVVGVDQSSPDLLSLFDVEGIDAHEYGDRKRLQTEFSSQILRGLIRPYGDVQSYWRSVVTDTSHDEWLDAKAQSGFQYGHAEHGWAGKLEGGAEQMRVERLAQRLGWEDSLRSVDVSNQFDFGKTSLGGNSQLQWKRVWEGASLGHSDSWVSEQKAHWDFFVDQGSITQTLGLTREHPLVPVYEAVAPGTGDVLYDSLARQFVTGVDKGNYIANGYARSDSLPLVEESQVGMTLENWWSPGPALNITQGFLRDIRLGIKGDWHMRDSTKVVVVPPFLWSDMGTALEGVSRDEFLLNWTQVQGFADMQWSLGMEKERTWNLSAEDDQQWWEYWDGSAHWADVWRLRWHGAHEVHVFNTSSEMDWTANELGGGLRRELPHGWSVEPALRMRFNEGSASWGSLKATLWQPSLTATWHFDKSGDFSTKYAFTYLQTAQSELPYQINEGFAAGGTHRFESRLGWTIKERVQASIAHVLRFDPGDSSPFQKFSGEAKAFF